MQINIQDQEELLMNKFKFRSFKYRNAKINLGYCEHCKLEWYAAFIDGSIVILLNRKLSNKLKSSILHKIIRVVFKRKHIEKSIPLVSYLKKDLGTFWV
jgi:carbamate kinase